MFTGIITGMGRIVAIHRLGSSSDHGMRHHIRNTSGYLDDDVGDSIALNGACAEKTRLEPANHRFTIDISASLDKTCGLAESRRHRKKHCAP
jgi:riboflavin synthase